MEEECKSTIQKKFRKSLRLSSMYNAIFNRQPRMPTIRLPRANTPPSTARHGLVPGRLAFQQHLALSVSGSCRTGIPWVGHETHPCGVGAMAGEPCRGSSAQGRSPRSGYQHDLYAQVRAFSHARHRHGGRYGRRGDPKSVKNGHASKNAHKGAANQKRCFTKENTSGFGFECLKSNTRRTFETAGYGRHHLSGRSGTEWPTVHRRKGRYGSSQRFAHGKYGGNIPHSRKGCL